MSQEREPSGASDLPADAAVDEAPLPSTARPRPDPAAHRPDTVRTLRQAMRRARQDDAERLAVQSDQRLVHLCRLEMLEEALQPLVAQIPDDVDLFDIGLMPGATPRLFIDMLGFIEMGRNARIYTFVQDTRHGRVRLAESADIATIVEAVTDYVARRLLEREKALASDPVPPTRWEPGRGGQAGAPGRGKPPTPVATAPARNRLRRRWFAVTFAFVIDLFGSIAFFTLLAGLGWLIWNRLHGQL